MGWTAVSHLIVSIRLLTPTSDKFTLLCVPFHVMWERNIDLTSPASLVTQKCHSLSIQIHSSPLRLTHQCQSDMFKQSYVVTFLTLKKKKLSLGPYCFLGKPFRIEQKSHHMALEVLLNQVQSPFQLTLSRLPSSRLLQEALHFPLQALLCGFIWPPISTCPNITHPSLRPSSPVVPTGD